MLACSRFHGSHTGEAILEEFLKCIAGFNITSKVSYIVSDSAANMVKEFSLPGFEELGIDSNQDDDDDNDFEDLDTDETRNDCMQEFYDELCQVSEHTPCFAHVLQLVIKDGFKQAGNINKVLSKCSTIVSHVKRSTHATDLLESEKRLKSAMVTRWNSQLQMIRSILRIPEEKLNSLDTSHLTTYKRKILEDIIEILTPFEMATQCVQGEKVVTSSMIIPCVRVLKTKMKTLHQKYNTRFVGALSASVDKRLSRYEDSQTFMIASALDPRFKLKWCTTAEYGTLKGDLISKIKSVYPSSDQTQAVQSSSLDDIPSIPPKKKSKLSFFDDLMSNVTTADSDDTDIDSVVDKYLTKPCLSQEEDPLEFRKNNQKEFSCIAKIVPYYLTIPASSAPVERLFSIAGKVFRLERCRLTDRMFETLMFMRCNNM